MSPCKNKHECMADQADDHLESIGLIAGRFQQVVSSGGSSACVSSDLASHERLLSTCALN